MIGVSRCRGVAEVTIRSDPGPQDAPAIGRQVEVAGIEDAQARWQQVRAKGRIKGIVALVVVLAVVFAIGILGKSNSTVIVASVIGVVVVIAVVAAVVGKQRTGLSLTPEWKPDVSEDRYDDDDPDDRADLGADGSPAGSGEGDSTREDIEPVRRIDAQILGTDLSKLGQVVSPKLAKSYAVGTLVLEGPEIVWEPGAASRQAGIEPLTFEPAQVASADTVPLWGSWALVRVASAGDEEWCMRVPGSVDLSPAFAELGLTLRKMS